MFFAWASPIRSWAWATVFVMGVSSHAAASTHAWLARMGSHRSCDGHRIEAGVVEKFLHAAAKLRLGVEALRLLKAVGRKSQMLAKFKSGLRLKLRARFGPQ